MLTLLAFLALVAGPWHAPVTPQGVGAIRIGMSFTAVQRIGGIVDRLPPALEADDVC